MITQSFLMECFLYCPLDGVLRWKARPKHHFKGRQGMRLHHTRYAGTESGTVSTSAGGKKYRYVRLGGKGYRAHRLIWLLVNGEFPAHDTDHINGNGLDNRLVNLRTVTKCENQRNTRRREDNQSGITGVFWYESGKVWRAFISAGGAKKHLGSFNNIFDAAAARISANNQHNYHENHGQIRPL